MEHLNTYHYNVLLTSEVKGLTKQLYFTGAKPVQIHCSTAHVLQPAPVPMYVHVHVHSYGLNSLWLGLITSELKGLTKKSS